LADAYSVLPDINPGASPSENIPKSNADARKALELDPSLAHPHAVLGGNEMEHEWDFAGGEAEYRKAFELDPNDATAHQWYSEDIGQIGGRGQEAIAEADRAHQLDPASPIIQLAVAEARLNLRQYDDAIAICTELVNANPTFAPAHRSLGKAYWGKRMYPQVIAEWTASGQLSGDSNESDFAAALAQGFRSDGWRGALRKAIDVRKLQRKTSYSSAYLIATLYGNLGDKDKAFEWLNIAYEQREEDMIGLETDFRLDPLRSDRRFAELVRKVGLPQQ
jgi:tetratricopeptide (TPR) repeat protein